MNFFPTMMVQQRQQANVLWRHTFLSRLISMFVLDILQIPSGCSLICSGCIAPSCTPLVTDLRVSYANATSNCIVLLIGSTCFAHYYTHHQELTTVMLITTLVVSFCKNRRDSVDVKLWFLVVYVQCDRTYTTKNHNFKSMLSLPSL